MVHVSRYLEVAVRLGVALAPAVDTLVGIDLDEAEVLGQARVNEVGRDVGDFLGMVLSLSALSSGGFLRILLGRLLHVALGVLWE